MSGINFFITLGLILGTILLIYGMKYFADTQKARARVKGEDAYRQLAETALAAQSETTTSLAAIMAELSRVATRLTAVEKILKEVE